jgi:hypothetical protein
MNHHKYGAVPKTTPDGIRHASTAEARRWEVLKMLERAGGISRLERQVTFPLMVNGIQIGKYVADFVYYWPNSDRVIEDVKGVETPMFRRSAKHMAAQGDPVTVYPPKPKKARKKK